MYAAGNLILTLNKYNEGLFFYLFVEKVDDGIEKYLFSLGAKIRLYDFKIYLNMGNSSYNPVTALRLFVPFLIEDNIEKLLYLDCDIVCKGDIEELFTIQDNNCAVAMGLELCNNFFYKPPIFDIYSTDIYCNSGVTLFFVNKYKAFFNYNSLFKEFSGFVGKLNFPDQDFLNYFFHGKIHFLKPKYNFMTYEYEGSFYYKKMLKEAKLVHFGSKPWNFRSKFYTKKLFLKLSIDKTIKKKVRAVILKGILLRKPLELIDSLHYLVHLAYQPLKKIGVIHSLKEKISPTE